MVLEKTLEGPLDCKEIQPVHPKGDQSWVFIGAESRLTKRSQEELPHFQGQGQRPRVPGCVGAGMAERNYPASEVSGGGWEELTCIRGQWWPRGDTPSPRSGVAAERSYPASEVSGGWKELPHMEVRGRGREEPPLARGQGRQPGGATPSWRPGAAAGRTNLRSGGCSGVGGPRGAIPC